MRQSPLAGLSGRSACIKCALRERCLHNPQSGNPRQVRLFHGRVTETLTSRMKARIDTQQGRTLYSMRLGIVEPVFGNIGAQKGMNRPILRGTLKVNIQWRLYCIDHNLEKLGRNTPGNNRTGSRRPVPATQATLTPPPVPQRSQPTRTAPPGPFGRFVRPQPATLSKLDSLHFSDSLVRPRNSMIPATTLWLFLLAALALFLSPGPNMAFVISHGVAHGRPGGSAAALGIAAADLVLTLLTSSGVTALIAAWAPSFDILRYTGAVYLLWLALQAIRSGRIDLHTKVERQSFLRISRRAMLNSLLNPKALLFFMVFLPQFADVSHGHVGLQLAILGCLLAGVGLTFNLGLGWFSGQLGSLMRRNPRLARVQQYGLAGLFAALAARLLLMDRPAFR